MADAWSNSAQSSYGVPTIMVSSNNYLQGVTKQEADAIAADDLTFQGAFWMSAQAQAFTTDSARDIESRYSLLLYTYWF